MRFSLKRFALLLLCFLGAACTATYQPPRETFTGYSQVEKLKLRVRLHISDELRQAKWARSGVTLAVGESLARNTETLTREVFADVITVGDSNVGTRPPMEVSLTPRLVYINRTLGATSFGESIISLKLEWTMADHEGRPIWINTVGGQASGSSGWTHPETVLKQAVEQLLKNSHQALAGSQAIRQFIRTQRSSLGSML